MSDRHKLPADYPITYRGLTLNEHHDAAGELVRANVDECYDVTLFDFSPLSIRDQIEGLHVDSGADLGVVSKEYRRIAMRGLVRSRTAAGLEDRVARLIHAFDPEMAVLDSVTTEGVERLAFWCPTDAPPPGYTSPVHETFFARPRGWPVVYERKSQGLAYDFAVELVCGDPTRYLYDEHSVGFSTALGWTRTLPNWAADMGVTVFPVLELILSGPGHASLTISDGESNLVLDMSTVVAGGGTFTIDMRTGEITKTGSGGGPRNHLRTSAAGSYFGVYPGGSMWTITNRTNLTSASATYRLGRS